MHSLLLTSFLSLQLSLLGVVSALGWTTSPLNPQSIPLAVRSPYLSCWLAGGNSSGTLAGQWPIFWTGSTLGWAGYVRVDGTTYIFLGDPVVPDTSAKWAIQTALKYTSTQSIFTLDAGPITLTATFLSPIEPTDLLRQSLPFSYLSISVAPNDGGNHTVQVYSDISAEWVSGNNSYVANWTTTTGNSVTHQVSLQSPQLYTELDDHAQYGSAYYAANSGGTYQTGQDIVVRAQFINNGMLTNGLDTDYRPVSQNWPVFAHAFDLGNVASGTDPTVFAVGYARDPAIQYITAGGVLQDRRSYFFSQYSSPLDALTFFLGDYSNALVASATFDSMVQNDASAISSDYAEVVAISARQAFGATELTVSSNSSDIMMFVKEISSDGNVNTVDVIFPLFPLLLYSNPMLGRYLLEPLFQYQETGQYPNTWAVHDMGAHYPVADGHNNGTDEQMPIEESGNMLIMTAAYIKATGDTSIASSYYNLLSQWASYLVNNSLIPANQLSTDDFAGALANQTNLAIKGIVGIAAMSQIATAAGNTADSQSFLSTAQSYVTKFQSYATSESGSHLVLSYGDDSSWGLTYNLYADILLGTNVFPQSLYDMQTAWYPTMAGRYGVPLDTRHLYTMTDWEIFMSAVATNNCTRDLFIGSVAAYLRAGLTTDPFPDLYDTDTGKEDPIGFKARPIVGAHFAHLALAKLGSAMPSGNGSSSAPCVVASAAHSTTISAAGASATSSVAPTTTGSGSAPSASSHSGAQREARMNMGGSLLWAVSIAALTVVWF